MKPMNWVTAGVLFSLIGCSGAGNSASEDPRGNLALALSAVDSQGDVYRLRNAEFAIDGYSYTTGEYIPTNLVVSSETNLDEPLITTRVLEGPYNVTFLGGGWYMERLTAAGAEPVEQAVFIGPNNQYAYVYQNSTSAVSFRFGVDGELIDFIGGDLQIGITVEHPGENTSGGFGGTSGFGGRPAGGFPGMGAVGGRG